jgi:V/A-type H+/Na+-transporting ATPase subunit I
MTLRPISARWFELVTVHKDLTRAMACLSRTGAVELEARGHATERLLFSDLDGQLNAHRELSKRYQAYWPPPASAGDRRSEDLLETLSAARRRLSAWTKEADPIIASIEARSQEAADLEQLREALTHAGADFPDLTLLTGAGPRLQARILLLPAGTILREIEALVLFKSWQGPAANYVLVVGRQGDIGQLETQLPGLKGRVLALPLWLPSSVAAAIAAISERIAGLGREMEALKGELAALSLRFQHANALGDIALVEWLNQYAKDLRGSERLAWVTGWTSDQTGKALQRALDAAGVHYLLRLSEAPVGANAPTVLANPSWARVFEVFARLLGVPARNESDPSLILAVIAPVVFGFMFGDVGQGLVLLIAGLALGRRIPLMRMLVPGGIMAMVFGVLFGSVFCRDDLVPALWIHPLSEPITTLIAAIAVGAVVLLIGILLDAVQAHWRGEAQRWWGCRAGLLAAYLGLLVAPLRLEGLALAALGAGWYILGAAAFAEAGKLGASMRAAGEFIEQLLRLLVNTISFARVGAFALAHAGLSSAILGMADAAGLVGYWIVLALGNILVIALEGMVVGIQTTRLMLFEFFIRFLTAGGREFKPLRPPDIAKTDLSRPGLGGGA